MFFIRLPRSQELVRREFLLDRLQKNVRLGKNISLTGKKKTGKTTLLGEFVKKEELPVYLDLRKISTPPESFSIEFVANACSWFLGNFSYKDREKFLDLDFLLSLELGNSKTHIKKIADELLKIKPDQKLLVQEAFAFVNSYAKQQGKKAVLCMDNFDELLSMNNFEQIKDVINVIGFKFSNIRFVVTSEDSHKQLGFEEVTVENFNITETRKLAEKILGKIDDKTVDSLYNFSLGNPYLVRNLCERFKKTKNMKRAFLLELVLKDSPIFNFCRASYNEALNKARGATLPKAILKVLSRGQLRLSEVARKIYRSAPVTKSLLERLQKVGLVEKTDSLFRISDNVLKSWIKLQSLGIEFEEGPDSKTQKELEELL